MREKTRRQEKGACILTHPLRLRKRRVESQEEIERESPLQFTLTHLLRREELRERDARQWPLQFPHTPFARVFTEGRVERAPAFYGGKSREKGRAREWPLHFTHTLFPMLLRSKRERESVPACYSLTLCAVFFTEGKVERQGEGENRPCNLLTHLFQRVLTAGRVAREEGRQENGPCIPGIESPQRKLEERRPLFQA